MIQPSQRQRTLKKVASLELHKHLARRRYWATRLSVCSSVALGVSSLCWLSSVRPTLHWVLLALGFFAGFALPVKPTRAWALSWIRNQIGLSYETALESRPDRFGFYEPIQERAKAQASRLEAPKIQAWWLPLFSVALGFALLPLIPKTLPFSITSPTTNPRLAKTPTINSNVSPIPPSQQDPNQASSPSPTTEETPQSSRSEAQGLNGELAQGAGNANRDNQVADQEALSRFLEELQQQHQQQGTADSIPTGVYPRQTGETAEESSQPQDQQTNPFEKITEPNKNAAENQVNQSQAGDPQGEQGQQENQSSQPSESQTPNQQSSDPQSQENSAGGSENQTRSNEENQALLENGEGQGAGILGGAPSEQKNQGLSAEPQQEPELLTGQINEGPQNVAGTVRLPTTTDESAPASNTASPSFRPADEEALTEGKIPLEYQNIVRNYFRY
jgi:hypothetical protein